MKRKAVFLTSVAVVTAVCVTSLNAQTFPASKFDFERGVGFMPIEPIVAKSQVEVRQNGEIVTKDIRVLTTNEKLNYLADTLAQVSVSKLGSSFQFSYLVNSVAREKGEYLVYIDYLKYFIEDAYTEVTPGNRKKIGRYRTGVGLRVVARVKTKKKKCELGWFTKDRDSC